MIVTFTRNDVLRYLYGETSDLETQQIKSALLWDEQLADFYLEARIQKSQIDSSLLEPSDSCINLIMEYSSAENLQTVS